MSFMVCYSDPDTTSAAGFGKVAHLPFVLLHVPATLSGYVPASLMDWKQADRVGLRLLRAADESSDLNAHPSRLLGALNSAWRELLSDGDTAATRERVEALLEDLAHHMLPPAGALPLAAPFGEED